MQVIIDFDDEEEKIISEFKNKWGGSKAHIVKKIVRLKGGTYEDGIRKEKTTTKN